MFLGDSITWDNHFVALVETHLRRRYPERALRLLNRGVRGDTVHDALARLDRDVVVERPQMVVVLLGINDGGYRGLDRRRRRRYLDGMRRLVRRLRGETRARLVLVTPTTVLPRTPALARNREMLASMAAGLIELGRRQRVAVIDLFSFFSAKLRLAAAARPPIALMADANHPNPAGHLVIATHLLGALDPRGPGRQPDQRVDLARLPLPRALTLTHDRLSLFVPPAARPVRPLLDLGGPHGQRLMVVGAAGPLRLRLADRILGTFGPAALRAGIALEAIDDAPWVRDAELLYRLLVRRGALERRLRPCGRPPCPTAAQRHATRLELGRIRRALAEWKPPTYRLQIEAADVR